MANVTRNDRQVSAVIAAYDAAQVLPRAIQSALAQTARPLEVLVVDDGSTDDTGAVAGRFGPPVRCIQQANLGASGARNRALEEVRSEFVAFLDADDEWHPQHLESALALFGRHPELAWTCAAYHRGVRGSRLEACRPREELLVDGSYFPSYFEIASGWTLSMNSLVVRRSVFDEVGTFARELATGEDLDLWFRIALVHPRIGYVREPTSTYWRTPGSLTADDLSTRASWPVLLRRNAERASALGPEAARRCRPLLLHWATQVVRHAALSGDRRELREALEAYGPELPRRWRLVGRACRFAPPPLWRLLVRLWTRSRGLRSRLRPNA